MTKPQIQSEPTPPFPAEKQEKPGIEAELDPRPKYQAPRYKPAGNPAYVFLASDADSSYITGETLAITGGATAPG